MSASESKEASGQRLRSLTVTLAIAFLALSSVILLISILLQTYFEFNSQRQAIFAQQEFIAEDTATKVQRFFNEKILALQSAISVGNIVAETSEEQRSVLGKTLGNDPSFRSLTLLTIDGEVLQALSRFAETPQVPRQVLSEIKNAITEQGAYLSPVTFDAITNEPLMWIAIPAKDVLGDTKHILLADVNLKFMWDVVAEIERDTGWTTFVVDRDGNLLAYTDTGKVLQGLNLSSLREVSEFIQGVHANTGNYAESTEGIEGSSVVSLHAPLGIPDWAVVIEQPVSVAYANVIKLLWYSLAIFIFSIVLAVVSGIYLSRRITKPILALSSAADEIASGKLDTRISLESGNEIGHLAGAFNAMAEKLQTTYAGLDEKIREKTAELSHQVEEVGKSKSAILNLLEDIEGEKQKAEGMVVERTKELSEEKARLLASINSLSFGFVLANDSDRIVLKNPRLKEILNYTKEPETIHDVAELLKSAGSKIDIDIANSCKRCMELKAPVEFKEVPYGTKFLRIICAPISSETTSIGYIFLVEDITEAKVLERSRDEFFSIASHELRTPLTAIQGNASMLLSFYADKIPDQEAKEMLTDISSAGTRLIKVVNDFLEVSRLEQGRMKFEGKPFSLPEVITEVLNDLKGLAERKKLVLQFEAPPATLPQAFADRDKVKEIIINFVANAINYTKAGSVTVTVTQEENTLKVRVKDTGIGIPLDHQSLLFRKFQQAGDTLARDITQSTGLGLYISRLLADAMGGSVALEESIPDKGSTFAITLPIAP